MQQTSWLTMMVVLLSLHTITSAQDLEWEVPEKLKGDLGGPRCPEGSQPDEKGSCIPTAEKGKPQAEPSKPQDVKPEKGPAEQPETPAAEKITKPPTLEPSTLPASEERPPPTRRPALRPPVATPSPGASKEQPVPEEAQPTGEPKAPSETKRETTEEGRAPAAEQPTPPQKEQPAEAPLPEPGKEAAREEKPTRPFVKGELANFIGITKLVTKNNRVGVCLGYRMLDLVHYGTVSPEVDVRLGKLEFGLGVPLAIEIFNGNLNESDKVIGFANAGTLRTKDWDEAGEFARFIRYLTYGKKEDRLFFNLSQVASTSIGHGALMRRYSVNIDPDSTRVSGEIDAYSDYLGFEFVANSIIDWDIFGGIGFVKPFSFFSDSQTARSFSIGFSYVVDRHAPVVLKTKPVPDQYYVEGTGRPKDVSHAFLHGLGVDLEVKVFKSEHADLKPYIDYSWLIPGTPSDNKPAEDPQGGGGLTIGILGRFNFGDQPVHALRTIAEFRYFSPTYLPEYFDTFYEVQKFIVNSRYQHYAKTAASLPPTKFYDVFIDRQGESWHPGFYLEFNYALVDYLAVTLALEGSNARGGNHFLAHLEVPALSWLQFFASFHQRGMSDLGSLFSTQSDDKTVFAAARMRILPFLFINFRYHYTFELRDGSRDLNDLDPQENYRFYEPVHGWLTDIELGWEF